MAVNDIELLRRLKQGDTVAFDYIYDLYYKPICFFSEKILTNQLLAEDIATESFVKLLQKNPEFDTIQQLRSFLYRTAKNACIDELRSQKRHLQSHEEIRSISPVAEDVIEKALITAELLQFIYLEIEKLPERYRNVVRLALVEGMENEEIVERTGLANQTVRNHKAEGIKLLRLSLLHNRGVSPILLLCILSFLSEKNL